MRLRSTIGRSDFREIREGGYYFVDKSALISELIQSGDKVLLLPRPRRFGKTLNLSMLHAFFDHTRDNRDLFADLAVSRDAEAMEHLNGYPTVLLSFKDLAAASWRECEPGLKLQIARVLEQHLPADALAQAGVASRAVLEAALCGQASLDQLQSTLFLLTEQLHRSTGKKVILLIDEYDTPIHKGHEEGYYDEVVNFMRAFLGAALKDNLHLERAVITGILRVAKESIYSGLNNLAVCSLLSKRYATHFGFTEAEVQKLLSDFGLAQMGSGVQAWYNGYRFGDTTIFNPWSILSFVHSPADGLQGYWIGTSGNKLIRDLVQRSSYIRPLELERLLRDLPVQHKITEPIALGDLTAHSIWSLLLFSGYLTFSDYNSETNICDLKLPNREVRQFFTSTLTHWLGSDHQVSQLITSLQKEDWQAFTKNLGQAVSHILSYHDTGGMEPERTYHVFIVGLLASMPQYKVLSNREAGHGRYDLALLPQRSGDPGFIFEFKRAQINDVEQAARAALAQIKNQDYAAAMGAQGIERTVQLGLAFCGKRIALATNSFTLRSGEQSPGQVFQLEAANPNTPDSATTSPATDRAKQIMLADQIQRLQEVKGDPVLPTDMLLGLNQEVLETILRGLKP